MDFVLQNLRSDLDALGGFSLSGLCVAGRKPWRLPLLGNPFNPNSKILPPPEAQCDECSQSDARADPGEGIPMPGVKGF